jgi:hypothetical protein
MDRVMPKRILVVTTASLVGILLVCSKQLASSQAAHSGLRFEISFPASVHGNPITGRVYVIISPSDQPEPRLQVGDWGDHPPFFGVDVSNLNPGVAALIDNETLGYPTKHLADVPAGDYYVQALVNIYTECHRSDGHTIWVHTDHWEGQQFNSSPSNLYSTVKRTHLDPRTGYDVKLTLTEVIPPVKIPPNTVWVKRIKLQSKLLTHFWGRPIYLGAVVLLPKGYDSHPSTYYPVIYEQGHFGLRAPFGFTTHPAALSPRYRSMLKSYNLETGYAFSRVWTSAKFPRMIAVTFQHPTPYFDDSYAVNSANNGPYGDALMTELIPYVETHFRIIREPYARVLVGGSTGGWESLALQVKHPDFFGGTWTLYPDPIDFIHYQLVDIYKDGNAFFQPGHHWVQVPRPLMREPDGQVETTIQDMSQLEAVLGSHGRSGQQLEAWEAVYGPVGSDGYPKPVWNKLTGQIDHSVADYMRSHGYDLTYYLKQNWSWLGPKLERKLHIYVGDMDSYYLNLAVYDLQNFLAHTTNPHYTGTFGFGRPEKGHGWEPVNQETMVRWMADHITRNAPAGTNSAVWKYE